MTFAPSHAGISTWQSLTSERAVYEQARKGNSEQAQLVRALILNAAELSTPVLIIGETGSGKNVVAQCIHKHSNRRDHRDF